MDSDGAAGRPRSCITEIDIRERLNLQADSLDVVRSLCLPGTYSDKISDLGRSLTSFTRLKHLDLSRNAIESLEGLQHLKLLESLNLYYNNIASLKEVFRLRHNTKLKEVDVRLNPVTKNEPDYRLFVVHMLVNLRRLDDRSVRDSERRAALMHFNSDQAHQFDEDRSSRKKASPSDAHLFEKHKSTESRKKLVRSLAPRPMALQDDTDELLELIAQRDEIMSPMRSAHHHHKQQSPQPAPHSSNRSGGRVTHHVTPTVQSHWQPHTSTDSSPNTSIRRSSSISSEHSSKSPELPAIGPTALSDLVKLLQEYVRDDLTSLQRDMTFVGKLDLWRKANTSTHSPSPPPPPPSEPDSEQLERLQNEVQALQLQVQVKDSLLQQKEEDIAKIQAQLGHCQAEATVLGQQLHAQTARIEDLEEAQQQLQKAQKEISNFKQQVCTLQEQNNALKSTLTAAPTPAHMDELHRQVAQLQTEKQLVQEKLGTTLQRQKHDLTNITQVQELAAMLQESHRSLVATNDHLLQELEEAKHRHNLEVLQMNANYEHLRKTIEFAHTYQQEYS